MKKKLLALVFAFMLCNCTTVNVNFPRDYTDGCTTDLECELEDMETAELEAEMDDFEYWSKTGKVRL